MSDYGQYTMTITASGFLTNHSTFRIDREKPFFIEKISLLPQPLYRELKDIQKIYQVSPDSYIMRSLSGNLIYSGGTIRGSINYSGALEHIGGSYFVGGGRIWNWESTLLTRATPEIENYVDTCPELEWQDGIFSCPQANSILTPSGKYMTGVLALR